MIEIDDNHNTYEHHVLISCPLGHKQEVTLGINSKEQFSTVRHECPSCQYHTFDCSIDKYLSPIIPVLVL
jgi:hypothetical protein